MNSKQTNNTNALMTMPTPEHVLDCIDKWMSLNLRVMSDSEVDEEIGNFLELLGEYSFSTITRPTIQTIYRLVY